MDNKTESPKLFLLSEKTDIISQVDFFNDAYILFSQRSSSYMTQTPNLQSDILLHILQDREAIFSSAHSLRDSTQRQLKLIEDKNWGVKEQTMKKGFLEFNNYLIFQKTPLDLSFSQIMNEEGNTLVSFWNKFDGLICYSFHFADELKISNLMENLFTHFIYSNLSEFSVVIFAFLSMLQSSETHNVSFKECFLESIQKTQKSFMNLICPDLGESDDFLLLVNKDSFDKGIFERKENTDNRQILSWFKTFIEVMLYLEDLLQIGVLPLLSEGVLNCFKEINLKIINSLQSSTQNPTLNSVTGKKEYAYYSGTRQMLKQYLTLYYLEVYEE